MSMLLLLPIGLAALAALLLPVLVHLARRSEQRTVDFAALRWLRALPQPRRKHRLEEWLLLLLRLLLVGALALLLAQPVLFGNADRRMVVAVAPGVDIAAARAGLASENARWHRLAPGFPSLDAKPLVARLTVQSPQTAGVDASLPSLLRQLDAELPQGAPLTVVVPDLLDDADAQRPILSRAVRWRVVAATTPAQETSMAKPAGEPALHVRHAPDRAASLRYLRAAGAAWRIDTAGASSPRDAAVQVADVAQPVPADAKRLAWLAAGDVPQAARDWVAKGGTVLLDAAARWPGFPREAPIVWHDETGALARSMRSGRGRVIRLERALLPASIPGLLEPDFPLQLRMLFADAPIAPARVAASDYAPRTGAAPYPERPRPLSPWLALLVAGLFLVERIVASGQRRNEAGRGEAA